MYVHRHISTCIHVRAYVRIRAQTCANMYIHVHTRTCIRVRGYVRGYVQAYAMWLCMDVPWLCTCMGMPVCKHIYVCVWLCAIMALPLCPRDLSRGYTRVVTSVCVVMCVRVLTRVWLCVLTRVRVMSTCVLMSVRVHTRGYVCTCLCPRAYVCYVMLCLLCYVMSVMLCYVCYVMSVMYTSPRRNHSVHEYKYFVKPLPSAA